MLTASSVREIGCDSGRLPSDPLGLGLRAPWRRGWRFKRVADLPGGPVTVQLTWVGTEEVPIAFVNQLMGQLDDRADMILTFGQMTPPALIGTPDEVAAQAHRLAYVPVKPVARFTMSRARATDMLKLLTQLLQNQTVARETLRKSGQGENL